MKTTLLFASIGLASGLLLINVYNSLVDTRSWGSDLPNSLMTARDYFKTVNPGNFYRIFSPMNQALGLLALILFWKAAPGTRIYLGLALALYVGVDMLTFGYFYPRNDIMFKTASPTDVDLLRKIWSEWAGMNWLRSAMLLAGVIFSCLSLHKIYLQR